jgi:hypothetical protein
MINGRLCLPFLIWGMKIARVNYWFCCKLRGFRGIVTNCPLIKL